MVSRAPAALTKISFRRDVRFFLITIIVLFVSLTVFLVLLLQQTTHAAEKAILDTRNQAMLSAIATFQAARPASPGEAQQIAGTLLARHDLASVEFITPAFRVTAGFIGPGVDLVRRSFSGGEAVFGFDSSVIASIRRRFRLTAAICLTSAALAALLLVLYVPRITRPIETMLDQARELGEGESDHDEVEYVIASFRRSIDTLKQQEAELQRLHDAQKRRADELERVTETLTRSLASGFIAVDRGGNVVEINATGRDILRLDPSRIATGVPVAVAFHGSPVAEVLERSFRSQEPLAREEVAFGDADERVLGLTTVPLYDDGGAFLGMIALFSDLTGVRQLEARVRELQTFADLGEMSAGIAHEFRNSLSTILGSLKLARRNPATAEQSIRRTEEEAEQLARAVDALLAFARPVRLNITDVDLSGAAREVVSRLGPLAPGIPIHVEGEAVTVAADPTLLTRAIENLVRNAIEAVQAKDGARGSVHVTTATSPVPSLIVSDDGIGIDPADASRLMIPFQSRKPTGMGLGLSFVRKIMLLHGGRLTLTGRPGEGATAVLEFRT